MKLAFLFADSRLTLHLVSVNQTRKRSNLTKAQLEEEARIAAIDAGADPESWDFVGALQNSNMQGPVWYEPASR